jgi:hypothetical protein
MDNSTIEWFTAIAAVAGASRGGGLGSPLPRMPRAKAEAMIIDHDGNEFDSTIELPSAVVTSALKSLDIPQL